MIGGLSRPAAAQLPTPEADTLLIDTEEEDILVLGFSAFLGEHEKHRIGVVIECRKRSRHVRATLFFGTFPAGQPMQAAVRSAGGAVGRFGPVVRGSPASGFHSPEFTRVRDVLELAFAEGSLISNGYNSIWNRIPEWENADARERIRTCAGAP